MIEKLHRFLDPIVAVRIGDGSYQTPNGNHRLHALKRLSARAVTALVVPEASVAYQILRRAFKHREREHGGLAIAPEWYVDARREFPDIVAD